MRRRYPVFITCTISLLLCRQAAAQNGTGSTYVFFKPIYAFDGNRSKLNETSATSQGISYTTGVYGSYARGFCFQAGVGKMISNNFGFELGAEWVMGKKIRSSALSDDDNSNFNGLVSERVRAAEIKPMIVFRSSGDLLSFYSKMGLAITAFSRHYADIGLTTNIAGQDYLVSTSQVDNTRAKVGFAAAFGLSARVSPSIAVTAELNGQMITLPVKDGHFTAYRLNGKDELPGLTVNDRSWVFRESVSSSPIADNKPSEKLQEPLNFSYIGVSVGIIYYF